MIELIIKKDDREINRYFLPQGVTTLGRAEDNTIILDDSCVSRRHARIKVEGSRVSIEDLNSGNGTFHGDQRIEREELADGDEIVIEPFKLLLRKDANPQKAVDSTRPVPAAPRQDSERLDPGPSRATRQPGGSAAGGPRLEVVRGEGGPYLLSGEEMSIGRSDEAVITLKDPSSSRKHASIAKGSRGWILKDLGSANGTYLNGAPVKDSVLSDGDIILIGNTELRFVDPVARESADDEAVPRTSPVPRQGTRGAKSLAANAKRAPEPEPEPEPEPAFEMHGGGSYDGGHSAEGSLPMDAPSASGTEVGGAPPPAWGSTLEATGSGEAVDFGSDDLNGNGNGYGDGAGGEDFGMELGDDALFPGGERPPDSLVGRYIFSLKTNRMTQLITVVGIVAFVLILMAGSQGPKPGGGGNKFVAHLDRKQEITLNTMEQFQREAEQMIAGDGGKKDFQGAFQKYGQIITFGGDASMANVRQAQVLRQVAIDDVINIHEYLVVEKLREVTRSNSANDAATKARIDKDRNTARNAMDRAKRIRGTGAAGYWAQAMTAWNDLLQVTPSDQEAKDGLNLSTTEHRKLVGEMNAQQLAELNGKVQAQMGRAASAMRGGRPKDYQAGIKEYEKVFQMDPENRTPFPPQATNQIAAAKRKLGEFSRPLRDAAAAAQNRQDWIPARRAVRQAIEANPYDSTLLTMYDTIEHECLKNAARQIQEAKVYMSAEDYANAKKAALLALQYADQPGDKENKGAKDILKQIQRNTETAH